MVAALLGVFFPLHYSSNYKLERWDGGSHLGQTLAKRILTVSFAVSRITVEYYPLRVKIDRFQPFVSKKVNRKSLFYQKEHK